MNQVFDFSRWILLVRKHWGDNRQKYTLSLAAIAALLFLWYGFLMLVDNRPFHREGQIVTYYVGLFITGSLYASLLFSDLANKPKAINFMSVPASHLEKVLCMVLYCVLIFFVCYTLIFYIVDFIMVKASNAMLYADWQSKNGTKETFKPQEIANVFYKFEEHDSSNPFNLLVMILLIFFAVQGAYALGSIYFPVYSFIKTTITLLLVILFFVFFISKVLEPLLPDGGFAGKLSTFYVKQPGAEYGQWAIYLPSWTDAVFFGFFKYVLAPVFWLITYFRLKEKEV